MCCRWSWTGTQYTRLLCSNSRRCCCGRRTRGSGCTRWRRWCGLTLYGCWLLLRWWWRGTRCWMRWCLAFSWYYSDRRWQVDQSSCSRGMRCLQLFALLSLPFTLQRLLMRRCTNTRGAERHASACDIARTSCSQHMCIHWRWTALTGQTLLNFLLLLQRLNERLLQSIRVLRFECLLHIGRDALFANHLGILVSCARRRKGSNE